MPTGVYVRKRKDLTGRRFNRLKVLAFSHVDSKRSSFWKCQCDCGTIFVTKGFRVEHGLAKSCGCLQREKAAMTGHASKTHGMSKSRFWNIWSAIKRRCYSKEDKSYKNYGGRNISMETRWHTFKNFKKDLYRSYLKHCLLYGEEDTTIDRIDVEGDYCRSNSRWATRRLQNNNRRNNKKVTYQGQTRTLADWSRITGIHQGLLGIRLKHGWPIKKTLETKPLTKKESAQLASKRKRKIFLSSK